MTSAQHHPPSDEVVDSSPSTTAWRMRERVSNRQHLNLRNWNVLCWYSPLRWRKTTILALFRLITVLISSEKNTRRSRRTNSPETAAVMTTGNRNTNLRRTNRNQDVGDNVWNPQQAWRNNYHEDSQSGYKCRYPTAKRLRISLRSSHFAVEQKDCKHETRPLYSATNLANHCRVSSDRSCRSISRGPLQRT